MTLPPREAKAELEAICASPLFARATRQRQLLRYLVEHLVEGGPPEELKESLIGVRLFGRPAGYDTDEDTIVRVTAGNLRDRLAEYYETEGRLNPAILSLPKGGFVPALAYNKASGLIPPLSDIAAQHLWAALAGIDQRTLPGYIAAFRYLDLALKLHPDHPRLLAVKAMAHTTRALNGAHPRTELERAETLVNELKARGAEPWESVFAHACVMAALYYDWGRAGDLFTRAVAMNESAAAAHPWRMAFMASQGRAVEAAGLLRHAVAHGAPAIIWADLAFIQILAGQLADAGRTVTSALEMLPHAHYLPYVHRALLAEAEGDPARAARAMNDVPLKWPMSTITLGMRALYSGLAGDHNKARWHLNKLKAMRAVAGQYIPAAQIGLAALGAGRHDEAVERFTEAAFIEHDPSMVLINVYPFSRHLFGHAGFRSLVEDRDKMGLRIYG